jgi:SAM-dependent methyltransferase
VQADLLQLPFRPETFDVILAEGVLHHTPSTERAFHSIVSFLKPRGELMAYVYRRKSPIREFTDDYVRSVISKLEPQEAWDELRALTAFARSLASLRAEVDLPEPIPYLGIPAGRHDVQRLVYWHFAKAFWSDDFTFEENNHVNFDWYHPAYAHRHTEEELRAWCGSAGLTITHFDRQESGFTIRASRN